MRHVLGFSVTNLRVAAEFLRNWICGLEARVERRAGRGGGGRLGAEMALLGCPAPRHARYVQEPVSSGSEGHLRTCRDTTGRAVSKPPLRHDSKDGVVAADAGAVLLVALLGVTDLEELRLREATSRRSINAPEGK